MAHQYWRIHINSTGEGWCSIAKLEFRATAGGADQATGGTALADGALGGNPASNAFDSDPNTIWHSQDNVPPHWLGYQFAAPVDVTEIAITSRNLSPWGTTQAPDLFDLEWSDDGSAWSTEESVDATAFTTGETKVFTFTPRTAADTAKVAVHAVLGASGERITTGKLGMHAVLGASGTRAAVAKLAIHTVIGPPLAVARVGKLAVHVVSLPVPLHPYTFTRPQII